MYVSGVFAKQSLSASLSVLIFLCTSVDLTYKCHISPRNRTSPVCRLVHKTIPTGKSGPHGSECCASLTGVSEALGKQRLFVIRFTTLFLDDPFKRRSGFSFLLLPSSSGTACYIFYSNSHIIFPILPVLFFCLFICLFYFAFISSI